MKQLFALITVFLVLMLVISTVMAVGNVKQSEQMTQRAQLISSLRADLRQAKKDQEQLTELLDQERNTAKTLRTERDALNKRFSGLMTVLRYQSAGYTDVHVLSGNGYVLPMGAARHGDGLSGEGWLQAQALQQVLSRLLTERTAALTHEPQDVPETVEPPVAATDALTSVATPRATISPTPATTAAPSLPPTASPTLSPAPSQTPASTVAIPPSPTATVRHTVAPTATSTPAVTPATAATPTTPSAPAPSAKPAMVAVAPPNATPTPTVTVASRPSPAASSHLSTLTTALASGLDNMQHFLRWMEQAVQNLTNALLKQHP